MKSILMTSGALIGGIGMFLLAVRMISDGLKVAAGRALRNILGRWTSTPVRGIRTGIIITALVQSSSAVTVATIGFVNAGLLTMYQSLGVIYGANIGTTMTGWLVAAVGFKFKVEIFALPLIGIGMLMRLTGPRTRRGALGEAIAGFGLFFIGIDILRTAFEGIAATIDIGDISASGIRGVALFVAAGFAMTLLTQSSSAAIAITLTAATGGLLSLPPAAAMVIGANLGTTSTAAIAVIGATSNAKRVAMAHVLFNGITGLVALLILPFMLLLVQSTGKALGLAEAPAVSLAIFHTTFNVLGVLLLWPATKRLSVFLEGRFRSAEELRGRPRYLDRNVAATPSLAVNALVLELTNVLDVVLEMSRKAVSRVSGGISDVEKDNAAAESLTDAIGEFVSRIHGTALPGDTVEKLSSIMAAAHYFNSAADLSRNIASSPSMRSFLKASPLAVPYETFRKGMLHTLEALDIAREGFSLEVCEERLRENRIRYDELKRALLNPGTVAVTNMDDLTDTLDQASRIRRLGERVMKGVEVLFALRSATVTPFETSEGETEEGHGP